MYKRTSTRAFRGVIKYVYIVDERRVSALLARRAILQARMRDMCLCMFVPYNNEHMRATEKQINVRSCYDRRCLVCSQNTTTQNAHNIIYRLRVFKQ